MLDQTLDSFGENRLRSAGLEAGSDYAVVGAIGHEDKRFWVGHILNVRWCQESGKGFTKPAVSPNPNIWVLHSLMQIRDELVHRGAGWPLLVEINALEQMDFHRW